MNDALETQVQTNPPAQPSCPRGGETPAGLKPLPMLEPEPVACCGPRPAPPSGDWERPGYWLWPFVEGFMDTAVGPVPQVKTRWERSDLIGSIGARIGFRNNYKIAPGLYAVGRPDPEAPVLVTANYKLTFDVLRKELAGLDVWLLVLDTRGINVWCAAGDKLFSTAELVNRLKLTGLEKVVNHRNLILPQLSATGVSALQVKRDGGFKVTWGPVRARDIKRFIAAGYEAEPAMRLVTFSILERLVLVPIEITALRKPVPWALLIIFGLSGLGPGVFSLGAAWGRGLMAALALLMAVLAGAAAAPILLPWLPGRTFSLKGAITGLAGGLAVVALVWGRAGWGEDLALVLLAASISSYLAMNFTGATPFTSPSGVEKEMRRAIPWQAAGLLASMILWIGAAFWA
ncbi:MAG: mercury methylation corrinoid protein HgcA [Thermodesulfobacteriota bacterium]